MNQVDNMTRLTWSHEKVSSFFQTLVPCTTTLCINMSDPSLSNSSVKYDHVHLVQEWDIKIMTRCCLFFAISCFDGCSR